MIRIHETHRPLLVVVLYGQVTLDDVAAQRAAYLARHDKAEQFGLITDVRGVELPDSKIRRALGDLANEFGERTKRDTVGVALLMNSRVLVGALTAIKWFVKSEVDITYHSRAVNALQHLEELGAPRGVAFPGECRAVAERLDREPASFR